MSLTPFQTAKMRKMFDVYDADDDGQIRWDDYEEVIGNLADLRGLAPGSDGYRQLENAFQSVWDGLRGRADADRDGSVSFDEMLAYNEGLMADAGKFEEQVLRLGDLIFDLLDADEDGYITGDEYLQFAESLRFDGDRENFDKLTRDGSDKLSKATLMDRIREFYLSEDRNAGGNWLFGAV